MKRRMVLITFAVAMIVVPFAYSLNGNCEEPFQGIPSPDLIVIEPAPDAGEVYLELVKQKIELLTPEELARETEVLQKELAELQAAKKLREAERKLEQLIDEFQGSSAAERARVMLDAGRQPKPRKRTFEEDSFEAPQKKQMQKPGSRIPLPQTDDGFGKPRSSVPPLLNGAS